MSIEDKTTNAIKCIVFEDCVAEAKKLHISYTAAVEREDIDQSCDINSGILNFISKLASL